MLFCRAKLRVEFACAVRDLTWNDGRRLKGFGLTYIKSFKLASKMGANSFVQFLLEFIAMATSI